MYYETFGKPENPPLMFLHGEDFVQCFAQLYDLSEQYYIIVPHIYGYGRELEQEYDTTRAFDGICEIADALPEKPVLVGFGLGAQLAAILAAKRSMVFRGAMFISPLLVKDDAEMKKEINRLLFNRFRHQFTFITNAEAKKYGLDELQTKSYYAYCLQVSKATLIKSVKNGIFLSSFSKKFSESPIPMYAICGAKETKAIRVDTINQLAMLNEHCRVEMWPDAEHDIPFMHADKLRKKVIRLMDRAYGIKRPKDNA